MQQGQHEVRCTLPKALLITFSQPRSALTLQPMPSHAPRVTLLPHSCQCHGAACRLTALSPAMRPTRRAPARWQMPT